MPLTIRYAGALFADSTVAINATTGDDRNSGSLAAPLRSALGASARLAHASTDEPVTIIVQTPLGPGDRFEIGPSTSLATDSAAIHIIADPPPTGLTATITAVGPIGNGPIPLQTSGVDWTLTTRRAVTLAATAGFIERVIDPDTVHVAGLIDDAGNRYTPAIGDTMTAIDLLTMPAPLLQLLPPVSSGAPYNAKRPAVTLQGFDLSGVLSLVASAGYRLSHCSLDIDPGRSLLCPQGTVLQNTRISILSPGVSLSAGFGLSLAGCLVTGSSPINKLRLDGKANFQDVSFSGAGLRITSQAQALFVRRVHFENADTPIIVEGGGIGQSLTTSPPSGASNMGYGAELQPGSRWLFQPGALPSVTGVSGQVLAAGAPINWGPHVNTTADLAIVQA